jgi:DNA-binding HxlR family transcriptional regulator
LRAAFQGPAHFERLPDLGVLTVSGKTLGENLEEIQKDGFFERNQGIPCKL